MLTVLSIEDARFNSSYSLKERQAFSFRAGALGISG